MTVWLLDYRHVRGEYDAIVSVEMIEAVGLPRLPLYFSVLERVLGSHYAETLRLWRERLAEHHHAIHALGLDETFYRLWTLYLAYSEAGFRADYLQSLQMLITRASPN